jgi:ureidoacrylate peracid hydrolase
MIKDSVAVLAVGLQNDQWTARGSRAVADGSPALGAALEVLRAARAEGVPVFHSPERSLPGGLTDSGAQRILRRQFGEGDQPCIEGTWAADFVVGAEPVGDEIVVPRRRDCAFTDTRLETILRAHRTRRLLIVGADSARAVLTTALSARARDHLPFVVADAVAGRDRESHAAALAVLTDSIFIVRADGALDAAAREL